MLDIIKLNLKQLLNDLDSGNSNISESEQQEVLDLFERINRKEYNKTQAAKYLGVSTGTINNYISRGWLPEGVKIQGGRKVWYKSDLDCVLKNK